jgi:hypothetical protein
LYPVLSYLCSIHFRLLSWFLDRSNH